MIYDINGNPLSSVYSKDGTELDFAYNIDGEEIFSKAPQPTGNLKVMTYNVGQWYCGKHDNVPADMDEQYYALQNGIFQRNNPDIACLNEYTKQFSKTGRTAISMLSQYFPYIHEQASNSTSDGTQRCICSKYPISNYTTHGFNDGSGLYYDSCTITVNGVPITVIVTHFHYSATDSSKRLSELNTIINFVKQQELAISCGDYNMLDCKNTSGYDYINMMQPILNAGLHAANCTDFGFLETYSDQPEGSYTGCLDNIITTANIGIVNAYVDASKLSAGLTQKADHMPLIAMLEIPT